MNIYVVDYWLPFPSSEYGGMGVYLFRSRDQLKRFILSTVDEYEKEHYPDYEKIITEVVDKAKEFELNPSIEYFAGVVDKMFT